MTYHTQSTGERLVSPQPASSTDESSVSISLDVGFHLLQNSRCRAVLRYLLDHEEEVATIDTVTDQVTAWETETTSVAVPPDARKRVYLSLSQIHLPTLAAAEVIEYDQERGTLAATPVIDLFVPFLPEEFHPDTVLTLDAPPDE